MVEVEAGVLQQRVFSVGAEAFTWADVVTAARLDGSWSELDQRTREALACRRRLDDDGETLSRREIVDATTRFRYERSLLAGEDLESWLRSWSLDTKQWRASIERALLRERWPGELRETLARFPVPDEDVAAAIWADAVCTGFLEQAAQRLAGDAGLAATAGQVLGSDEETLVAIRAAAERACATAVTEEAIEREIAGHTLEWLLVEGELLDLPSEDIAREAALCVVHDGRTLADVGVEIGIPPATFHMHMDDADPSLAPALLAAREGELIGPIAREAAFTLILVERKVTADAADPEARERAGRRLAERVTQRAVAEHVEWHGAV